MAREMSQLSDRPDVDRSPTKAIPKNFVGPHTHLSVAG